MPQTRLSDDTWLSIDRRVNDGEAIAAIAREFGMDPTSVSRMLERRFGRPRKSQKSKIADPETDAIYQRLLNGESVAAIARELGRDSSNLYNTMRNRYGYQAAQHRRSIWEPTLAAPTEVADCAYIAGIIDGEGSIIRIRRGKNHPLYMVKVNMTDRPVIEYLHSFGGKFTVRPAKIAHYKEQYQWDVSRQLDVQALLTAIVPYMRVKRDKAHEALNYLASSEYLVPAGRTAQTTFN
ncbi:hypothetical protein [Streptomyces sp. NPDC001296]